jgi:hypothetical protein
MKAGLALGLTLVLAGCVSAPIETSWRDPAVGPADFRFSKVLAFVRVSKATARRTGEDAIVRVLMSGPRAKAGQLRADTSYRMLDDRELGNVAKARRIVEEQGFDAVVIMSFVSAEQKLTVHPGSYGTVWGYYGAAAVYDPGYARTDTIVRVETAIYRIADGKLLWTGISRAQNPKNVEKLVEDVALGVGDELRKEGLIP